MPDVASRTVGLGLDGQRPICMKCGSDHVRYQTTSEGLWAAGGEGVAWVCESCHHIGAPFLIRPSDHPDDPRADLWRKEYADAAFQLENDLWHPPAHEPGRSRSERWVDLTFIALGLLFLAPVAAALHQAVGTGILLPVLHALVATGWLMAIGVVLLVVGIRRLRAPGQAPDDGDAAPGADPETGSDGVAASRPDAPPAPLPSEHA